ncbi:MAG: hypothetical protein JWM68_1142 [Verrucomicrobiales bacterium]|nr:hypothetical protein [Verrucomicrobiales bacterium]
MQRSEKLFRRFLFGFRAADVVTDLVESLQSRLQPKSPNESHREQPDQQAERETFEFATVIKGLPEIEHNGDSTADILEIKKASEENLRNRPGIIRELEQRFHLC